MFINWTKQTTADIDGLCEYLQQRHENTESIESIVQRIVSSVERLASFPFSGRIGKIQGVRELLVKDLPYIIHYQVEQDEVLILRVIHSARDYLQ